MLIKTYTLRPHCVSCWTAYILQDDTRSLQCQLFHMFLNKIDVLDGKFVPMFVTVMSVAINHEHR